ncbi:hypothetical protein LIA77_05581 [Sarocladium implicatum]|nr:hypothetical protein LIA77_05581 [Sarocladium implicatum]
MPPARNGNGLNTRRWTIPRDKIDAWGQGIGVRSRCKSEVRHMDGRGTSDDNWLMHMTQVRQSSTCLYRGPAGAKSLPPWQASSVVTWRFPRLWGLLPVAIDRCHFDELVCRGEGQCC